MNPKSISFLLVISALTACGGSSDGTAVSPTQPAPQPQPSASAAVLETFDDGSGVARAETTSDGFTFVANVMGPDIQGTVNEINSGVPLAADYINDQFVGSNQYGDFYSAQTFVNGQLVDVLLYVDINDIVTIAYGEGAGSNLLLAGGEKVSNIPSGTFTYTGTNVVGNRDGSASEDGTFTMGVNFNTQQASINGSTPSTTIDATDISVNNVNGTFSTTNLNLGINGNQFQGTLLGNFHGDGAVGVSGIYHDNGGDPGVAGAIAGTR